MTHNNPLVSIIINNYNYGFFIAEAIQSALGQSYQNIEIIVVDDGSTDQSPEVIRSYQKRYPGRIRAIMKDNGGQASAMNVGFKNSNGEIVCFLDSDDYWFGNKIESIIIPHERCGFVQHNLLLNGGRYRLLLNTGDLPRYLKEYGLIRSCVPTSAQSFRRQILEKIMPMPEKEMKLCADVWLRCGALYFSDAISIDDCLGVYRVHGNNGWHDNLSKDRPNIANELVESLNKRLMEQQLAPIPIRKDSREKSFIDSVDIQSGCRYLLYGAGDLGEKMADRIRSEKGNPICFIDEKSELQGKRKAGLPVYPPSSILEWKEKVDKIVVSSIYVERIYEFLTDMGMTYPKDILLPIDLEAHTERKH